MADGLEDTQVRQTFPERPQFQEFMKPCRFEGEINALEIRGKVPLEIDGTFYRVMPDPQLPPSIENDPVNALSRTYTPRKYHEELTHQSQWFNGDGNISAFRIKDGRCDFKQRYVRTEKFVRERDAKRALIGKNDL
jgi:carotenoid cleavage dioxygenase-like enzyme